MSKYILILLFSLLASCMMHKEKGAGTSLRQAEISVGFYDDKTGLLSKVIHGNPHKEVSSSIRDAVADFQVANKELLDPTDLSGLLIVDDPLKGNLVIFSVHSNSHFVCLHPRYMTRVEKLSRLDSSLISRVAFMSFSDEEVISPVDLTSLSRLSIQRPSVRLTKNFQILFNKGFK